MNVKSSIAIVVLAFSAALPAKADTTLHYQVSRGELSAPMVLKARPGEIRVEGAAVGERFQWMIYRSADNTLYAVDPQHETYLALDPAAVDRIAQRLDALRADLRKRLDKMPVGQRKFVESQIGDFLKPSKGDSGAMTIDMSEDMVKINDIACHKGRIVRHDDPVGELCVASTDALGLKTREFEAYKGLYHLIDGLQTALSNDAASTPDITALDGVPIRMSIESGGITQQLERVAHQPLPDALFEIPDNYRRQEPQDLID